jgi:isochorismate hydrolase
VSVRQAARARAAMAMLIGMSAFAQAPAQTPAPPPAPAATVQEAPAAPPVNEDEQQTMTLLADLQRYATAPADELRRELASVNQASNPRVRTDVNRIRLAVLLTMPNAGPPDDGRALALLESVAGKTGGASPLKQLAFVLYAQIAERVRNVAEERKRTAFAQEKLDQLRAVERSLLLERSRNAGGAGGGGGGGTGR